MDDKKRKWSLEEHKRRSPQLRKVIEHQDEQHRKSILFAKINIWLAIGLCILGIIATFFITNWGIYHSLDIQEQRDSEQMKLLEPNISIEISEISENQLKIIVSSMDENRSGIKDFFLDLELPGVFLNISTIRDWRTKGCIIRPSAVSEIHFSDYPYTPEKERMDIACESINPFGYYVAIINYLPTESINWTFGNRTYVTMPIMDLRDYQEYRYSWEYNGQDQDRSYCVNLSHLDYIKKDNENFIHLHEPQEIEELENAMMGHFCYKNMSCLLDYEEYKRRNIC